MKTITYSRMESIQGGGLQEVVDIVDGGCAVGALVGYGGQPYIAAFCIGWGIGRWLS